MLILLFLFSNKEINKYKKKIYEITQLRKAKPERNYFYKQGYSSAKKTKRNQKTKERKEEKIDSIHIYWN